MNKKCITWLKIALFTFVLVFVDQISKYWANMCLKGKNDIILIKNVLHLHYLDGGNRGAAWGVFSGKTTMFIIFTLLAILIILFFIRNILNMVYNYSLKNNALIFLYYLLALLMAGAIGNLIDRVTHQYVIDFIYFNLIDFPIFNVADCYVTISCILIVLVCIFKINDDEFNKIFTFKVK